VVDVNYFPGYKEVPRFPALLAQYLTQKAVESRIRNQG
jgi:inositol-1,3,4-trisphosphate 5/6-kinase/inositol-tetrakisphosphate 1-kinase